MHIGIRPVTQQAAGGNYQYGITMLQALCASSAGSSDDRFTVFYYPGYDLPELPRRCEPVWDTRALVPRSIQIAARGHAKALGAARRLSRRRSDRTNSVATLDERIRKRRFLRHSLRKSGVELVVYPSPLAESFEGGLPFVIAIHDLQHLLQPEFPEVSVNGEFERREYVYRNCARYATTILADSDVGREDILHFYERFGVTEERVKVLPFLPPAYLSSVVSAADRQRVRKTYALPDRYLFYPANFWPHKNHVRLVRAIGTLKRETGLEIHVAFTGASTDGFAAATAGEVANLTDELGLVGQIHHLGHVPNADMSALYGAARALTMPTFFGPTNIPVVEAWASGCPVLTSDVRGIREQVGDAGLLIPPRDVGRLAEGIHRLWTDDALCRELAERGRTRLATYGPDDYRRRLASILDDAKASVLAGNSYRVGW